MRYDSTQWESVNTAARTKPPSSRVEVSIYACFVLLWVMFYPVWSVWEASHRPGTVFILRRDGKLKESWNISPGQYQDVSCIQWQAWKDFILSKWLTFALIYIVIGNVTEGISLKHRDLVMIIFSSLSLGAMFGWQFACLVLSFNTLGFCLLLPQQSWIVWLITLMEMFLATGTAASGKWFEGLPNPSLALVCLGSVSLRFLSFGLDYCKQAQQNGEDTPHSLSFNLIDLLTYNLYPPLLVTGPLVTYEKFCKQVRRGRTTTLRYQTAQAAPRMLLCLSLGVLLEIINHSFYFHGLATTASILKTLEASTIMGLVFWCVLQQYLMYYVLYELPAAVACFDDITVPGPPVCVFSYHTFREHWRLFDRGLYTMVVTYIYFPLVKMDQSLFMKSLGVLCCFLYTAAWLGGGAECFTWAILCWAGIQAEVLAQVLKGIRPIESLKELLSSDLLRRFQGIAWCPTYLLLMLVHTLMLIGSSIWDLISTFFYKTDTTTSFMWLIFLYCMVQLHHRRERRRAKPSDQ